jgi:hypothetical protein
MTACPSRAKIWSTLQLRGQIHSPYFSFTPICTLWGHPSLASLVPIYLGFKIVYEPPLFLSVGSFTNTSSPVFPHSSLKLFGPQNFCPCFSIKISDIKNNFPSKPAIVERMEVSLTFNPAVLSSHSWYT